MPASALTSSPAAVSGVPDFRAGTTGTGAAVAGDLIVDLRGQRIDTLDDFWDAVSGPCGLPSWFGRNLDAWADTIQARGISEVVDRHDTLVVHVGRSGLFARRIREARALRATFAGRRTRLVVHPPGDGTAAHGGEGDADATPSPIS